MRYLRSFSDIPGYFQRFSEEMLLPNRQQPAIPFDKLPHNNNSGLYFNYILDFRTGEMAFLSRRFFELTGYNEAFFKQGFYSWQQIICPNDRKAVLKSVSVHTEAMLNIGKERINDYSDNATFRIKTRFGALLTLLRQRLYIVMDDCGNFLYEAGMFLDMTPFRRDGNLRLVIHAPDGSRFLEYFPKEDAVPLITTVRETLNDISQLAVQADHPFLRSVQKILSTQFADTDFDVTSFGEELCISRSQLYRQLEKHAGIAPKRFIRIYRLKQSLEHLAQTELSISEVAWRVGFKNPSWFSKCFYEEFDCTPSDYRELMR